MKPTHFSRVRKKASLYTTRFRTGVIIGLVLLLVVGGASFVFFTNLPSPTQLNNRRISQSTKLYDRTGEVLLYEIHGEEKRTVIPFETIPEYVKKATLAAEDAHFYEQPAFSWTSIVRAILVNLRSGRFAQGGSTISQQLVKNVFLTPERTVIRKLKELILAVRLETNYSKDEILSFYLNQIPYGSNAYGIEAASQTYFGKSANQLSLREAAALASLPKAPSYYSPWGKNTDELEKRVVYVLDRMQELGFATPEDVARAKKESVVYSPQSIGAIRAPHFSLTVKEYLINTYGESMVLNGGLRVKTTLDWKLQQIAEKAVEQGAARNLELYHSSNAALVAQDPKTGQILSLVGSRNYFDVTNDGNFNVPVQGMRQPGSALKPFVYMTAFQKGYTPKTVLFDVATEFDLRGTPETSYQPSNFDGVSHGPISMESALARSLNVPAVKTLYLAGFDDVLKNLHQFGITTLNERWRYGLSLTLGGGEVTLIDLVNAYGTLSQDGVKHAQSFVMSVENSKGDVLEEYYDQSKRVIDPQYPRLITKILSDPELRSPIFGSSNALTIFPDHDVALKTGTSEDHRDAWAVGYTPSLVVGVWAGNNDNTPMVRNGSSILAAVPLWNDFLKNALPRFEPQSFEAPEPVPSPTKPMLNGQYELLQTVNTTQTKHIHSILYYVDRNDPLGPIPENPRNDPQFENWESAVINWGGRTIPNFSSYNINSINPIFSDRAQEENTKESDVEILSITPENGSFIQSPLTIQAKLSSVRGLKKVELFIDRKLVNGFDLFGKTYVYKYTYSQQLNSQTLIELRVTDALDGQIKRSFVLYH